MKRTLALLLGCLALTCFAFPTRDITPVPDPDKDDQSNEGVHIPEREGSEQFRRRRQMNPGQGEPEEPTTAQPFTDHPVPEESKPSESRRRRHAETEIAPGLSRLPSEQSPESTTEQSSAVEGSTDSPSGQLLLTSETEAPSVEEKDAELSGMKPVDARRRRNAQVEIMPVLAQQQLDLATTEEPSTEESYSTDMPTEETRQRRHVPGHTEEGTTDEHESTTSQPSTEMPSSSGQPSSEGMRRRRQSESGSESLPELTTEQLPSQDESTTAQTSTEQPMPEEVKPIETRKRRYAQLEMELIMSHQDEPTTEEPSTSTDGQSSESTTTTSTEALEKTLPEARYRRHMPIRQITGEQTESTTEASSTEVSFTEAPETTMPGSRRRRHTPTEEGTSGQAESTTEASSTEAPETTMPGSRLRRHTPTEEGTSGQTESTTKASSTEAPETTMPGSRLRRHTPTEEGTSGQTESTTEMTFSQHPDLGVPLQSQPEGLRQKRNPQEEPGLGVQLGYATSELPSGESQEEEHTTAMPEEAPSDRFWQRKAHLWANLS
uniref:Uncharacterized protein n=1 Tax=Plectus sambesii TaxID=2011161 RepID=A0A914WS52_9BILA